MHSSSYIIHCIIHHTMYYTIHLIIKSHYLLYYLSIFKITSPIILFIKLLFIYYIISFVVLFIYLLNHMFYHTINLFITPYHLSYYSMNWLIDLSIIAIIIIIIVIIWDEPSCVRLRSRGRSLNCGAAVLGLWRCAPPGRRCRQPRPRRRCFDWCRCKSRASAAFHWSCSNRSLPPNRALIKQTFRVNQLR